MLQHLLSLKRERCRRYPRQSRPLRILQSDTQLGCSEHAASPSCCRKQPPQPDFIVAGELPTNPAVWDCGALLVDKPKTWTSFDVCNKLKGALKVKKVSLAPAPALHSCHCATRSCSCTPEVLAAASLGHSEFRMCCFRAGSHKFWLYSCWDWGQRIPPPGRLRRPHFPARPATRHSAEVEAMAQQSTAMPAECRLPHYSQCSRHSNRTIASAGIAAPASLCPSPNRKRHALGAWPLL